MENNMANNVANSATGRITINESVIDKITTELSEFLGSTTAQGFVVGLSGGVDSAVVAALAVKAVSSQKVQGVLMQGPFSTPDSLCDAIEVVAKLGIERSLLPITDIYEEMTAMYESVLVVPRHEQEQEPEQEHQDFEVTRQQPEAALQGLDVKTNVAKQNLQARLRAVHLMYVANYKNLLVLNTGNKSEAALGYTTLYGDGIGAIAPIGDLYKTQVYELAKLLNTPQGIINKPPSAELYAGQLDSDDMPAYDGLDEMLFAIVEEGKTGGELSEMISRVKAASFKRAAAPRAVELSSKPFSVYDSRFR